MEVLLKQRLDARQTHQRVAGIAKIGIIFEIFRGYVSYSSKNVRKVTGIVILSLLALREIDSRGVSLSCIGYHLKGHAVAENVWSVHAEILGVHIISYSQYCVNFIIGISSYAAFHRKKCVFFDIFIYQLKWVVNLPLTPFLNQFVGFIVLGVFITQRLFGG